VAAFFIPTHIAAHQLTQHYQRRSLVQIRQDPLENQAVTK
jgi:hypothetical protein